MLDNDYNGINRLYTFYYADESGYVFCRGGRQTRYSVNI